MSIGSENLDETKTEDQKDADDVKYSVKEEI